MPDLIEWAAAVSLVSFAVGVAWATRRAGKPDLPGGDCGLNDLMAVASAAGVVPDAVDTADAVHGHGCGIECDDLRLNALAWVYGPMFARQLSHVDANRYTALYLVPDGGGAA